MPAPPALAPGTDTERGLVVVGGGPAGLGAARAYREHDGTGRVTLLTPEPDAPYFRPALSKELLRGEQEPDDLALVPDGWWEEHGVDLRRELRVAEIDPEGGRVRLRSGEDVGFGTCVLATGAVPVLPDLPGADHPDVIALRSLRDALALRERAASASSAVVLGSGFIGCEAAVSLAARGLEVTLVTDEPVPHAARLGEEVGTRVAGWLAERGVRLVAGQAAEAIEDGRRVRAGGGSHEADLVLLGLGVTPDASLAEGAGLAVRDGRVVVDAAMRTSAAGVLAAGDAVLAENRSAGRRLPVAHWGEAEAMGAIAGATAAGVRAAWEAVPGFWTVLEDRVIKHLGWGDGFDEVRLVEHGGGPGFTAWQGSGGIVVGAVCHDADGDYARAADLVRAGAPLDSVAG